MVVAYRALCPDCETVMFLCSEYDPFCWWFEVLECLRRLVLTSFLPIHGVDVDSLAQVVIALLVALVFASAYAHLRPFVSDHMDVFANCMQAILFLNILAIFVLQADAHIDSGKVRTGFGAEPLGVFVVVMNSLCVVVAAAYNVYNEGGMEDLNLIYPTAMPTILEVLTAENDLEHDGYDLDHPECPSAPRDRDAPLRQDDLFGFFVCAQRGQSFVCGDRPSEAPQDAPDAEPPRARPPPLGVDKVGGMSRRPSRLEAPRPRASL